MVFAVANGSHAQLEEHRSVLRGHCYRMRGAIVDAEDAVQETIEPIVLIVRENKTYDTLLGDHQRDRTR